MGVTCRTYGREDKRLYRFVEKKNHEGGRPPVRPSTRWENNIKTDLKEIRYDCVDWDQLALDRDKWRALVMMVMNLRVYEKWEIF